MHRRTEKIDALTTGYFRVEPVTIGDVPQSDELIRGDLTGRYPGNDGVGAVLLDVPEVVVVCVLKWCMVTLENVVVPASSQY